MSNSQHPFLHAVILLRMLLSFLTCSMRHYAPLGVHTCRGATQAQASACAASCSDWVFFLQAEMAESPHTHDSSGIVSLIVKDTRTK